MDNPKFKVGDSVLLTGVIQNVQCTSLERGWIYEIKLEGQTMEDCQMFNFPNIHERAIKNNEEDDKG